MHRSFPQSWQDADTFLSGGRSKSDRPIANNTRVVRRGDDIAVRLHATDVVTFGQDGAITLDSGGWRTMTTKDRMNACLPIGWSIGSDRGRWSVYRHGGYPDYHYTKVCRYSDGITLRDGEWSGDPVDEVAEAKVQKAMEAYIRRYVRALGKGIPMPSGGDCWACCLYVTEGPDTGKAAGDVGFAADHLLSHLEDDYHVPSLLINAFRERGYREWQYALGIYLDSAWLQEDRGLRLHRKWGGSDEPDRRLGTEVARTLRHYLKPRLLPSLAR